MWAKRAGTSFARFRLSTAVGLQPTGLAPDGEVEDHPITISTGIPPIANNDPTAPGDADFTTSEDSSLAADINVTLLINDVDPDAAPGDTLTVFDNSALSDLGAAVLVNYFLLVAFDLYLLR